MGGVLGLDWGQKKIGYATADENGIVVTPRGYLKRKGISPELAWKLTLSDVTQLKPLIEDYEIDTLILGLPLALNGDETASSTAARQLAVELGERTQLPVVLINEALSSWNAQRPQGDDDARAAAQLLADHFAERARAQRQKGGQALLGFIAVVFLVAVAVLGYAGWRYYDFSTTSLGQHNASLPEEILIDIPPASNFYTLERQLRDLGLTVDPLAYKIWLKLAATKGKLKFGEYLIKKDWSALTALREILRGKVILHQITIKEGDNIYDILQTVAETSLATHTETFDAVIHDPQLLDRMGVPQNTVGVRRSLEGFLFPETYSFQKYDGPRTVVEAILREFDKRALPVLKQHPWGQTAAGRYRLMTLASVVEKESGVFSEQPMIASVFWNRLAKKMQLQSDPTIIYGLMPNFDGNIHRNQIHQPHPYNTYTVKELPIGPISNPGENAIKAVVHPATSANLFFVSRGDGTHVFSADYKTHQNFVNQYQLHLGNGRAKPGKSPAAKLGETSKRSPRLPVK